MFKKSFLKSIGSPEIIVLYETFFENRYSSVAFFIDAVILSSFFLAHIASTRSIPAIKIKKATVKRFNTIPEAFQDLKNGGVDAVVVDYIVAIEFAKSFDYITVNSPFTDDEYYGIGVTKKNTELLNKINEGLESIKLSGKYDEIYNKYFNY